MQPCDSLKEKIREPLLATGIIPGSFFSTGWSFHSWSGVLLLWYNKPAWTLFTDALKGITVTEAEWNFYRDGLRHAGLSQKFIDTIPLNLEKKPFKPYAGAIINHAGNLYVHHIVENFHLGLKTAADGYLMRCDGIYRFEDEAQALRILRDVCGEDDLIEKVKEYARLSGGLRQGWSEHCINYRKLLDFIESEQAKMKEGSNG